MVVVVIANLECFLFDYSKAFSRSAANWRATLMVRSRWVLFTGTPSVLASARAKRMIVLICRLCHDITSSTTRRTNRQEAQSQLEKVIIAKK